MLLDGTLDLAVRVESRREIDDPLTLRTDDDPLSLRRRTSRLAETHQRGTLTATHRCGSFTHRLAVGGRTGSVTMRPVPWATRMRDGDDVYIVSPASSGPTAGSLGLDDKRAHPAVRLTCLL
jgi:hypothetical protein